MKRRWNMHHCVLVKESGGGDVRVPPLLLVEPDRISASLQVAMAPLDDEGGPAGAFVTGGGASLSLSMDNEPLDVQRARSMSIPVAKLLELAGGPLLVAAFQEDLQLNV